MNVYPRAVPYCLGSPMKIAFIRHSIFNRGGDRLILEYANYLAQKGHEVVIYVNFIDTVFTISPLIKVNYFVFRSKLWIAARAIFTKFPCDMIIPDIAAMAALLSIRNNRKIVYLSMAYDEYYYSSKLMRRLVRALYFYALRLRKIPVIAISHGLSRLFKTRFQVNVSVVPAGIDPKEFYPEPSRELLTGKGSRKAILIFVRGDYRKGLDIAIEILNNIVKTEIKDRAVIWTIGGRIDVPGLIIKNFGVVDLDTLRNVFSSSDVFLFPSRHEGFGLMVLEAMACGCAVVTTAAVPVVTDNKDALISAIGDVSGMTQKLILLLRDENLRGRLISEGYKTVKNYDLNNSKQEFEKVLLNLRAKDA